MNMTFFKYRALIFFLIVLSEMFFLGCTDDDKNITIEKNTENINLPCKLNDTIYKKLFFGMSESQHNDIVEQRNFNILKVDNDSFFFFSETSFYKDKLCNLELEFYNWDTIVDQTNNLINFLNLKDKDWVNHLNDHLIEGMNRLASDDEKELREQSKKEFIQYKYKAKKESKIPDRLNKVLDLYTSKYGKPILDDTIYMHADNYVSGGMYIWNCKKYSLKIEFVVKKEIIEEQYTKESETYHLLENFIIRYYDNEVYDLYTQQELKKYEIDKQNFDEKVRQKNIKESEEKEKRKKLEQSTI